MAELLINYKESWIYIDGNKSKYKICTIGEIINTDTGKYMKGGLDKNGYHIVSLTYNKRKYTRKVHRLVAEAFIPNPDNLPEVNHKNGKKNDNKVDNLEWILPCDNKHHAQAMGLCPLLITPEKAVKICKALEDAKLSFPKIAKKYKVPQTSVRKIYYGVNWRSVSKHYDFSKFDPTKGICRGTDVFRAVLDEKTVKMVCKLINKNMPDGDIASELDISPHLVYAIHNKKTWKHISDKYF